MVPCISISPEQMQKQMSGPGWHLVPLLPVAQTRLGNAGWSGRHGTHCTQAGGAGFFCSGGSPGLLLALSMACLLPSQLCCRRCSHWRSLLATEPSSLSLPLSRQSLMCRSRGAASPDSQAPCASPFGQVIDSSVILLNGSCIGIQGCLRIRETRSLAVIGPPCVR